MIKQNSKEQKPAQKIKEEKVYSESTFSQKFANKNEKENSNQPNLNKGTESNLVFLYW